jgi:hypothetical protein
MRIAFEITKIQQLSQGLLLCDGIHCGEPFSKVVWGAAKVRKPTVCALSEKSISTGEVAYRPVGNFGFRGKRIDASFAEHLAKCA